MTTATQKSELLEALQSQWEEIYTQSLNDVLSDNSLTAETKTEGIKFLNHVDNSMKNGVLIEFETISEVFYTHDFTDVILEGVENLFGKPYLDNGETISCKVDECSEIDFDPFTSEGNMFCDYTAEKNGWYLSIRLNEISSKDLILLGFEY